MAEEQNTNRFSARPRDQSSLDGFFGDQPHRPAGAALGRVAANHGDDALTLLGRKQTGCARPLLVVECALEPALLIAPREIKNRLPRQRQHGGDLRRAHSVSEPLQRHRSQRHANLFDSAGEQLLQRRLILLGNLHTQSRATYASSLR